MFTTAELLQLVDYIYAGVLDPSAWQAAVAAVCRAFGGERGGLFVWDSATHRPLDLVPFEIDEASLRHYGALVTTPDMAPLWNARTNAAILGLVVAEVHAQSALWTSTALFEEWLVPSTLISLCVRT